MVNQTQVTSNSQSSGAVSTIEVWELSMVFTVNKELNKMAIKI